MSSVTLQPAAAVYREEQYFDWRVYALIALVGLLTGLGLLRGRVWSARVRARPGHRIGLLDVRDRLSLAHDHRSEPDRISASGSAGPRRYPRVVSIHTVRTVEVVTYRPIADYGFWGIRSGRDGERASSPGQSRCSARADRRIKALDRQPAPRGARRSARRRTEAGGVNWPDVCDPGFSVRSGS